MMPSDPYTITYQEILALSDPTGGRVELVERFDCVGGAMWAMHHYAQSPLVRSVRTVGGTCRYLLEPGEVRLELAGSRFPAGISRVAVNGPEILVEYVGLGGGGVGASVCRARAPGVLRCEFDESGGGKRAGSRVWLPRRERVLIGIDDTDTPDQGATWTLAHNIARAVEGPDIRYLSHTIVQLFPVAFRTKNCVSTVCEFATTDPDRLMERFRALLEEYTLSPHTGMAVYRGFDPAPLRDFARRVKRGEIRSEEVDVLSDPALSVPLRGRGRVGAVAAIPYYTDFREALSV